MAGCCGEASATESWSRRNQAVAALVYALQATVEGGQQKAERLTASRTECSFQRCRNHRGYDMMNRRDLMLGGLAGAAAYGLGRVDPEFLMNSAFAAEGKALRFLGAEA